jgi:hypothetical protein
VLAAEELELALDELDEAPAHAPYTSRPCDS